MAREYIHIKMYEAEIRMIMLLSKISSLFLKQSAFTGASS